MVIFNDPVITGNDDVRRNRSSGCREAGWRPATGGGFR